jgi:hypothetical protein
MDDLKRDTIDLKAQNVQLLVDRAAAIEAGDQERLHDIDGRITAIDGRITANTRLLNTLIISQQGAFLHRAPPLSSSLWSKRCLS